MIEHSSEVKNYIKDNFESMTYNILVQRLNERFGIGISEDGFKKLLRSMGLRKVPVPKDSIDELDLDD